MSLSLENLLERLRVQRTDTSLTGVEARVWARLSERQRAPSPSLIWGWRSAAAVLLLSIGIAAGASAAHVAHERSPFEANTALAPSTLLGRGE
jgi:hypothetical protein